MSGVPWLCHLFAFPTEASKFLRRTIHPNPHPLAFPPLTYHFPEPYPFVLSTRFRFTPHSNSDLERLNPTCVALGARAALALNSNVQRRSTFDRRHHFYPDLPAGYQITQHYRGAISVKDSSLHLHQLTTGSYFPWWLPSAREWRTENRDQTDSIRTGAVFSTTLPRFSCVPQVVQDTGKSTFDHCVRKSSIDLNTAGTAPLETASDPDIRYIHR